MTSLKEQLIEHEGIRLQPYRDSEGYLTIGVGRLIDPELGGGITEEEAMYLLDNDVRRMTDELTRSHPVVATLSPARRDVLINMAFNMGVPRLSKFTRTWAFIRAADYDMAAVEMLDSLWARRQVGGRAVELSNIMRDG